MCFFGEDTGVNNLKVLFKIAKLIERYCDQPIGTRYLGILNILLGAVHSANGGNELARRKVKMK